MKNFGKQSDLEVLEKKFEGSCSEISRVLIFTIIHNSNLVG